VDEADVADGVLERAMDSALQQLRSAAERRAAMDAGLVCMACGEAIPEERRRALPGVCTCVPCQEKIERGMGR